jgi:Na+/H+-translocating membrane pyrophosphatase
LRVRVRVRAGVRQTKPDYRQCIDIATKASLREMIAPGVLVIASPILVGSFGGVEAVSGLLAGAIVSSVQVIYSLSPSKTIARGFENICLVSRC